MKDLLMTSPLLTKVCTRASPALLEYLGGDIKEVKSMILRALIGREESISPEEARKVAYYYLPKLTGVTYPVPELSCPSILATEDGFLLAGITDEEVLVHKLDKEFQTVNSDTLTPRKLEVVRLLDGDSFYGIVSLFPVKVKQMLIGKEREVGLLVGPYELRDENWLLIPNSHYAFIDSETVIDIKEEESYPGSRIIKKFHGLPGATPIALAKYGEYYLLLYKLIEYHLIRVRKDLTDYRVSTGIILPGTVSGMCYSDGLIIVTNEDETTKAIRLDYDIDELWIEEVSGVKEAKEGD